MNNNEVSSLIECLQKENLDIVKIVVRILFQRGVNRRLIFSWVTPTRCAAYRPIMNRLCFFFLSSQMTVNFREKFNFFGE